MSFSPDIHEPQSAASPITQTIPIPREEEIDDADPQVEFCNLSSRSLQRPSDHYIPPPRRSHIASRLLRDPWTTALTQFSKVTNYVLNPYDEYEGPSLFDLRNTFRDQLGYARQREENAHYGTKRDSNLEHISLPPPALPQIECSVPQQRLPPLTEEEYYAKYVHSPRKNLLERIFKGGISSHSLRRQLWPIVLGITDSVNLDWTPLQTLYNYYSNQWRTILPDQETRFTAYRERKSLIDRDVVRCDRTHSFFADSTGNVEKLRQLLMTYIMYDFDTGYVQGMTDLAAPLLYVWNGDIPKAFWSFVQIMNLFKRNFEMSQKAISNQLKALIKLVRITDPVFAAYLRNNESENCYFAFRWIICLFKREFMKRKTDDYDDCLTVWETIWSVHSLTAYEEDREEKYLASSLSVTSRQIEALQLNLIREATSTSVATITSSLRDVLIPGSEFKDGEDIKTIDERLIEDEVDRPRLRRPLRSPPPPPPSSAQSTSPTSDLITMEPSTTTVATISATMTTVSSPSAHRTKSIQIASPPRPRPVLSSSPLTPTCHTSPPNPNLPYALSPPVQQMYLNLMTDQGTPTSTNDYLVCSPSSVGSKGSIEEIKRFTPNNPVPTPNSNGNPNPGHSPANPTVEVGKQESGDVIIGTKPLDSSDELRSYEFDHLLTDHTNPHRLIKLENFELFCLCICLAIMRRERDIILIKKYEAAEILKHFNTLQLNESLDAILVHAMSIWHWLKHDGGEKALYGEEDKPGNTSVDDFDLLNDEDEIDCQAFTLNV